MTRPVNRVLLVLACLAGLSGAAHAQTGQPATVKVQSTRDPVDKSYRKMIRGMERFEREHALAPNAPLRFQLLPRSPTVDMRGITLRVAGNTAATGVTFSDTPDANTALVVGSVSVAPAGSRSRSMSL